jgi:hypothetical protein
VYHYRSAGHRSAASGLVSDALFRAGQTADGQPTYTPRLLLYELQNGLGSLSQHGALYAPAGSTFSSTSAVWEVCM